MRIVVVIVVVIVVAALIFMAFVRFFRAYSIVFAAPCQAPSTAPSIRQPGSPGSASAGLKWRQPRERLRLARPVLESPSRLEFGTVGKVSVFASPKLSSLRNAPTWAIALVLSLALALALIASNLIHASLASRDLALEGRPGALLYVSAFSGFADEWDLYDGQQSARVVDEQLELRVGSPQTAAWSSARPRFGDFDFSVTVTASDGPIDNAMGLVYHLQEIADGACDLPAIILCPIEQLIPLAGAALRQLLDVSAVESHFAFMISSDGYYSLWKTHAGETQLLSAWIPFPHIEMGLGAANRIRVIARESSYRFFINGAQVSLCLPDDKTARSTFAGGECLDGAMQDVYHADARHVGKLGLIAQSTATGGAGVVVRFDNLLVFSPSDPRGGDVEL